MSKSDSSDGLTEAQREEVERLVEEQSSGVEIGRRGVLGGIAAAAGVGAMSGGAAGQSGGGQESMALGGSLSVDESYQISGNWYAGPESAKPSNPDTNDQLFWTVTDAKSGHVLRWEYWDGSAWVQTGQQVQEMHSESISTDELRSTRANHPGWTPNNGVRGASGTYEYHPDGPGLLFDTVLDSKSYETQGLTYGDGQLYVAEVTDSSVASTIHELNLDGTATGETYQLPDSASHPGGLDWEGGIIWAVDYNGDKVYKVDWSAKSLLGSFDTPNITPSALVLLPRTDGEKRMLVTEWQTDNAWIIDHEQAISDGSVTGNYRTISKGLETAIQGLEYRANALYASLKADNRVCRIPIPFADEIPSEYTLFDLDVDWIHSQDLATDDMQDLAFNPDDNEWYTCDLTNTGTVYSGTEGHRANAPTGMQGWNTEEKGAFSHRAIRVDSADFTATLSSVVLKNKHPARMDIWVYDRVGSTLETYFGFDNYADSDRVMAVIDSSQSTYGTYDTTNSTNFSTGVSRVSSPQWIVFRFVATGSEAKIMVSKDYGTSFQTLGTKSNFATNIARRVYEANSGYVHAGKCEVQPFDW